MKRWVAVAGLLILCFPFPVFCTEVTVPVVEYDLSEWEKLYSELPQEAKSIFGGRGIKELIEEYKNGGTTLDLRGVYELFTASLRKSIRELSGVLGTALICAIADILTGDRGTGKILMFCLTGLCIYGIASLVCAQFENTLAAAERITGVTETVSPVILVLLSACGNAGTAATVQPGAVLLCGAVSSFYKTVIMPLTLLYCALATAGCITGQKQLKSTAGLIRTAIKWCIGASITVFLGSVSIRAINGAGIDNAGIKTIKYAVDKSIPIVGGMITGAYESLRSGAVVLKNAAGTVAVLLCLAAAALPALEMLSTIVALRVLSCLCSVSADGRISGMLDAAADSCTYMFAVAAAITLMNLVITAVALLCSGG